MTLVRTKVRKGKSLQRSEEKGKEGRDGNGSGRREKERERRNVKAIEVREGKSRRRQTGEESCWESGRGRRVTGRKGN